MSTVMTLSTKQIRNIGRGSPNGHRRQAIGAYIFAGGFTLGVSRHFDVLCHLEETEYGVSTCHHNMPNLSIFTGVDNWPIDDLRPEPMVSNIDLVYGNPPCAAWSGAGYTKLRGHDKWRTDPRVSCTVKHFGLLNSIQPTFWVWESVTQAFTIGKEFVDELTLKAVELGYSVTYLIHDAQWLGLPQVRRRFFMICHKYDYKPIIPDFNALQPTPISVLAKASEEVKNGPPCWGQGKGKTESNWTPEQIAIIPPGTRLAKHWEKHFAPKGPQSKWPKNKLGQIAGRPSFGHYRLHLTRPGGAVVGYGLIHPTEHRFITTEEMQLLCGFPPDFVFTANSPGARASEMARGVCPPVADWVACSIRQALDYGHKLDPNRPTVRLWNVAKPRINIRHVDLGIPRPKKSMGMV